MFKTKIKIVEFPDCKNESQVIKKLQDKIQHYNHISMINAGNAVKIQTCTDKYGRDSDNPYIKLIGNVEYLNGKYVLKYSFTNKIKYMYVAIIAIFIVFFSISFSQTGNFTKNLILSAVVIVSGGLFALNNFFNASYNISTIEEFLQKFGEIKELN
ncbi:MAG: hypothetical protein ACI4VF_02150 [Lachnospirales bacterium]